MFLGCRCLGKCPKKEKNGIIGACQPLITALGHSVFGTDDIGEKRIIRPSHTFVIHRTLARVRRRMAAYTQNKQKETCNKSPFYSTFRTN